MRYFCAKKQKGIPMQKVNKYCLLVARCPELRLWKSIIVKGRLKKILIPVVPADMADMVKECE